MANLMRGFRRIAWILTIPAAAFSVFVFFDSAKEFSTTDYETAESGESTLASASRDCLGRVIPMSNVGIACLPAEVPLDVVNKVIADYVQKQKSNVKDGHAENQPAGLRSDPSDQKTANDPPWLQRDVVPPPGYQLEKSPDEWAQYIVQPTLQFTVHRKVNGFRLIGLVATSIAVPGLILQCLVSVVAWIVRGFKS